MTEKKFRPDNGSFIFFWVALFVLLFFFIFYVIKENNNPWFYSLYFLSYFVFMLSVVVKEFVITDKNFLEIRVFVKLINKNRRIPLGDIVAVKKIKSNQVRLEMVRGFEILKINAADIDAFIQELKERNPRIIIADDKNREQE